MYNVGEEINEKNNLNLNANNTKNQLENKTGLNTKINNEIYTEFKIALLKKGIKTIQEGVEIALSLYVDSLSN